MFAIVQTGSHGGRKLRRVDTCLENCMHMDNAVGQRGWRLPALGGLTIGQTRAGAASAFRRHR